MDRRTLLALVFLALCGQTAVGDMLNLSTGLDGFNHVIGTGGASDAHWTVSQQSGGTGPAQTVFPNNPAWFSGAAPNSSTSDWIVHNAGTNNGPVLYAFTATFDLTGFDLSTAFISGEWAVFGSGTLDLNGNIIARHGPGAWGFLAPFSVSTGSPMYNQGLNTLTITVTATEISLAGPCGDAEVHAGACSLGRERFPPRSR
jgi:hypothetical protein